MRPRAEFLYEEHHRMFDVRAQPERRARAGVGGAGGGILGVFAACGRLRRRWPTLRGTTPPTRLRSRRPSGLISSPECATRGRAFYRVCNYDCGSLLALLDLAHAAVVEKSPEARAAPGLGPREDGATERRRQRRARPERTGSPVRLVPVLAGDDAPHRLPSEPVRDGSVDLVLAAREGAAAPEAVEDWPYGGSGISEGIYRYGKIPVYTGIYPGPFSHTGYFAFGRPVDGYAAAAGLGRGEPESHRAARARAAPEVAPLGATRLKADARDAPPFLIIGKVPVRAALGPARRAVARRGAGRP